MDIKKWLSEYRVLLGIGLVLAFAVNGPVGGDEPLFFLQASLLHDFIFPVFDYFSKDVPVFLLPSWLALLLVEDLWVLRVVNICLCLVSIGVVGSILKRLGFSIWVRNFTMILCSMNLAFLFEGSAIGSTQHGLLASLFGLFMLRTVVSLDSRLPSFRHIAWVIAFGILAVSSRIFFGFGVIAIWLILAIQCRNVRWYTALGFLLFAASLNLLAIYSTSPEALELLWDSYIVSSRLFSSSEFYGHFGDFKTEKLEATLNVFYDFLTSFRGQSLLYLSFCIWGYFLALKNGHHGQEVRRAYNYIVWYVIGIIAGVAVFSSHGFTWHYFGCLMPTLGLLIAPLASRLRQKSLGSKFLLYLIFICYLGYGAQFWWRHLAADAITNSRPDSLVNLNADAEFLFKNIGDNAVIFTSNPYFYFKVAKFLDYRYVNSSWLDQIFLSRANTDNVSSAISRGSPSRNELLTSIRSGEFDFLVIDADGRGISGVISEHLDCCFDFVATVPSGRYKLYAATR